MGKQAAAPKSINVLRTRAVQNRVGLKKTAIMRRVQEGTFPRPVQLGSQRAIGWVESEVECWLADRIAERDSEVVR